MSSDLLIKFKHYLNFYRKLNNRNRLIVIGGFCVVILFIWYILLMVPLNQRAKIAKVDQIEQLQQDKTQLQNALDKYKITLESVKKQSSGSDDGEFTELKKLLDNSTLHPSIDAIMNILLKQKDGLQLLTFKTTPIVTPSVNDKNGYNLHRIALTLSGSYPQLMAYLKRFSNPNFPLFFDSLSYQVKQYPTANITLTLDTITQENADGVKQ